MIDIVTGGYIGGNMKFELEYERAYGRELRYLEK